MSGNENCFNESVLYHYKCSDRGLILPVVSEYTWSIEVRAVLYLLGLLYCFMGVAIIADIFMSAIEMITSKKRKIYLTSEKDDEPEVYEVHVWSNTVANLTLMALGSSAPEILLSIIEVIGNNFEAGDLGPSTIVGSAAFNLFFIIAVCVVAIPSGEVRRIKNIKVFGVTAIFSLVAYLWLLIILLVVTPNVVDVWEAVVTFVLFPLLVVVAWAVERLGAGGAIEDEKQVELGSVQPGEMLKFINSKDFFRDGHLNTEGLVAFVREVKKHGDLTDEDAALLAASRLVENQSHSRMWYRVGAIRSMTGSRRLYPQLSYKLKEVYNIMNEHPETKTLGEVPEVKPDEFAVVEFHTSSCSVMENIGKFQVAIQRSGRTDIPASVRIESVDGTAVADQDYIKINEIVTFEADVTEQTITVEIINDNQWEPEEEFYLKLSTLWDEDKREHVQLGRISILTVSIIDNDEPGVISFEKRGLLVSEGVGSAAIPLVRKNGSDGEVSITWKSINKSALDGRDFKGGEGVVVFKHGEIRNILEIPIINDMNPEKDEHFEIEIIAASGGAKIGKINRTAITITSDDAFKGIIGKVMYLTNTNIDAMQIHQESYFEQIKAAVNVNGGDVENATAFDYIFHLISFPWKTIFAFVPPPGILGGWVCFFVSLACIGVLTAIIGDFAAIFGCLVGLEDAVTAITLVALGTSLPDTFASKQAAMQEKYADSAVGNVTGSNSVNVFLGLGLPWLIAAVYHYFAGSEFVVIAGSLGFSVAVFTVLSIVCLALLMLRRVLPLFGKGELGGPALAKYSTGIFLIFLWLLYVLLSILKIYEIL